MVWSFAAQKIPVERSNGKKCDELAGRRDKATGYVTNSFDGRARLIGA
jgi:hypothetical protein